MSKQKQWTKESLCFLSIFAEYKLHIMPYLAEPACKITGGARQAQFAGFYLHGKLFTEDSFRNANNEELFELISVMVVDACKLQLSPAGHLIPRGWEKGCAILQWNLSRIISSTIRVDTQTSNIYGILY
jgi:hypothetical protein